MEACGEDGQRVPIKAFHLEVDGTKKRPKEMERSAEIRHNLRGLQSLDAQDPER